MSIPVFIPTRNRIDCLERVLPKWQLQFNVGTICLVVEKWEYGKHRQIAKHYDNVAILKLPDVNRGINYARAFIVDSAKALGQKRIIMADDDIYPRPNSDVQRLIDDLDKVDSLGIGIMVPFYGLMFGNDTIKQYDKPLMSKGALGKRLFSLDIDRVLKAGNFDIRLHSGWGDDELVRDGMKKLGAAWYVHAGVHGTSIAGRYTPGGLNDLHNESQSSRLLGQLHSHNMIYQKWGDRYINKPKLCGRLICKWQRMLDDFVPNWREKMIWQKK